MTQNKQNCLRVCSATLIIEFLMYCNRILSRFPRRLLTEHYAYNYLYHNENCPCYYKYYEFRCDGVWKPFENLFLCYVIKSYKSVKWAVKIIYIVKLYIILSLTTTISMPQNIKGIIFNKMVILVCGKK